MEYNGQSIRIKDFVLPEGNGEILAGKTGYIEGNWHKTTGKTFYESIHQGNLAAFLAFMRISNQYKDEDIKKLITEKDWFYVKIDGLGHILMMSELEITDKVEI